MFIGDKLILLCVALFKSELNLVSPAVHPTFYSLRLGSYTVIQDLTGGPKVVGSLYSMTLSFSSSK
jgi:hypothetical protein